MRIQFAAHAAQRLVDRFELLEVGMRRQRVDLLRRIERIEPRAFADLEADRAAERVGQHENVGEDDRGVEAETADRLQRHFGGQFRCEAQIEKAAGLGAHVAVFRQIAAGLAHHPDRRHRLPAAGEHLDKRFDVGMAGQSLVPSLVPLGHGGNALFP